MNIFPMSIGNKELMAQSLRRKAVPVIGLQHFAAHNITTMQMQSLEDSQGVLLSIVLETRRPAKNF